MNLIVDESDRAVGQDHALVGGEVLDMSPIGDERLDGRPQHGLAVAVRHRHVGSREGRLERHGRHGQDHAIVTRANLVEQIDEVGE